MGMGNGSGRGQTSDMNVTPLIDVLLVLLIIFMVITPLTPQGLAALVPQPPRNIDPQPSPESSIVVQVLDRGFGQEPMVKINQEDATWENLQGRLTDVYKMRAEKVMFVKADDSIAFESVAKAIAIGHASGADKVGLITKTDLPKPTGT